MPGLADRRSLTQAIYDSLVVSSSTAVRLTSRGAFDTDSALRLRRFELQLLEATDPKLYESMCSISTRALKEKHAGNHYVYMFHSFVCGLMYDKAFLKQNQSKEIRSLFTTVSRLLEIKMPDGMAYHAKDHLPAGLGLAQSQYMMLRYLYEMMNQLYSESGRHRGSLQEVNTKNKLDHHFKEAASNWLKEKRKMTKGEVKFRHCIAISRLGSGHKMTMVRVSDLTYLRFHGKGKFMEILLTPMHFTRTLEFLKKLSNIVLGLTLSYGMESNDFPEEPSKVAVRLIHQMAKMGVKDDLAPGEAGKAVTDLYKASLSQTPELPWDNYNMLLETYDERRGRNAERLYDYFCDYHTDHDVKMNLTYVWKTCPQPDSDIRGDFHNMCEGVSSPNPISDRAAETMELSFRRAFLVGLLKEKRIPHIFPTDGKPLHPILQIVQKKSSVSDSDIRKITWNMMRNIMVKANDVFPRVDDTSHLGFKDKSSSVAGIKIRRQVERMEKVELEVLSVEDRLLKEALDDRVTDLLKAVRHNHEFDNVGKLIQSTANDIITSLDEDVGTIFAEADEKYRSIVESLNGISSHYGDPDFADMLVQWAKQNPDLQVNTGTEPKLGEVHKRTVRIFFMFEKGMKTFLSQFERMSRIMDYYIKGAEIVKGDRAREKHMNVLSSAHKSTDGGILAYQILFDLSKFSQRFNHRIIDAAAKVIGEATSYPHYAHISSLFKASYLYVSARFIDASHVGVLGAFEGFLNFLWTGIHATVMDVALRECGRSGDLAAYSDDGLLMFTMQATLESPKSMIHEELKEVIGSIVNTYREYGLDFNLGKTLISRTLSEFLGVIQYRGRRLPTWMKELCKLGISDENSVIKSVSQEVNDTASQISALVKAGMNPYAASFLGYLEVLASPCRRVRLAIHGLLAGNPKHDRSEMVDKTLLTFLCLLPSFGGVRLPDPLTMLMTADYDPVSEMIHDIGKLVEIFPDATGLFLMLRDAIEETDDYTPILMGASPVHTSGFAYDSSLVKSRIIKILRNRLTSYEEHPLSRDKVPELHLALENLENISVPIVASLTRYIVPMIEYSKVMAPTKSSSLAKLLKKHQLRKIQKADTRGMHDTLERIMSYLAIETEYPLPTALELYRMSYPRLSFAPPIPSYRKLASITQRVDPHHYEFQLSRHMKDQDDGTDRLENTAYTDDLSPPLVSSDVNMQHLSSAPDVPTHCMRALYAEVVSAASGGHDIVELANIICKINGTPKVPGDLIATIHNIRKLSVANRKKSSHRVYWSNATRSSGTLMRSAMLNIVMTMVGDMHYSMIITVAIAMIHLQLKCTRTNAYPRRLMVNINRDLAIMTRYTISMSRRTPTIMEQDEPLSSFPPDIANTFTAIESEMRRTVEGIRLELADALIVGRLGMIPSFRKHDPHSFVVDPVRFSMVWTLINKLDSFVEDRTGNSGVSPSRIERTALDQLPVELTNLAILYRIYRQVRKSEIKLWLRGEKDRSVVPEEIVSNTLSAAREMGVIHSVTKKYLMSKRAAGTYMTILKAQEYDIIYYALDHAPQGPHAGIISHPRAKAAGRVIDKIITDKFESKIYGAEADTERLVMKIFRGCVRGSAHRSEPYNPKAVKDWIDYFTHIAAEICILMPQKYKIRLIDNRTGNLRYPEIPRKEINWIDQLYTLDRIKKPVLGHIKSHEQVKKYLVDLTAYGMIKPVADLLVADNNHSWYSRVHKETLEPAMAFVRTTSYGIYEDALQARSRFVSDTETQARTTGIELLMEKLARPYWNSREEKKYLTTNILMDAEAQLTYREQGENKFKYDIRFDIRDGHHVMAPALLMYSLGLPTLLAAGKTGVSKIKDMRNLHEPGYHEQLEHIVSESSLTIGHDYSDPEVMLFYGMSEWELRDAFVTNFSDLCHEVLVVVEIPPRASVCSVGIIKWLTSTKYSYLTVGMSSDGKGVSMYVISLDSFSYPYVEEHDAPEFKDEPVLDFGYESIQPVVDSINSGRIEDLVTLALTPYHQVGLPVAMRVFDDDKEVYYKVSEELIDRSAVSFVQTSRPSHTLVALSRENPMKSALLQKALLAKMDDQNHYIAALSAAAYYYAAEFSIFSYQDIFDYIFSAMEAIDSLTDKCFALRVILDPLISIEHPPLSALTPKSQLLADRIPGVQVPEFQLCEYLNIDARTVLGVTGYSLVPKNKQGVVGDFIYENGLSGPLDEFIEILKAPPDIYQYKEIAKSVYNPGLKMRKASQYGLVRLVEATSAESGTIQDKPQQPVMADMLRPALRDILRAQEEEAERQRAELEAKRIEMEAKEKQDRLNELLRKIDEDGELKYDIDMEESDVAEQLYDHLISEGFSEVVDKLIEEIPNEMMPRLLAQSGFELFTSVNQFIESWEASAGPEVGVTSRLPPSYDFLEDW